MATIAELEAKIKKLKAKKKTLNDRKSDVEKVQSKMNSDIPVRIMDANKKITACEQDIMYAISIPGNEPGAAIDVREKQQNSMDADQYMGEVATRIRNEILRCGNEITALENQISTLQAELIRLKEEKAKEFIGGLFH